MFGLSAFDKVCYQRNIIFRVDWLEKNLVTETPSQ
jgi:hypothetical protein